jgi:hypothetical protein
MIGWVVAGDVDTAAQSVATATIMEVTTKTPMTEADEAAK